MPEIKNQFTGGKMNKDLDERLVPKGEYRDAMNIQVSTSEDSDVGTVQNILGNSLGCPGNFIPNDAFTVGSISDEKNDALYWMVSSQSYSATAASVANNNSLLSPVSLSDQILRKTTPTPTNPTGCERVFVDEYGISQANISTDNSSTLSSITLDTLSEIDTGWEVTGIDSFGNASNTVLITSLGNPQPYTVQFDYNEVNANTTQSLFIGPVHPSVKVGDGILIPFMYDGTSVPNTSTAWYTNGVNHVYIQNWVHDAADLIGESITLFNYEPGLSTTYQITNAVLANLVIDGLGIPAVKVILDTPLDGSFDTYLDIPPQSSWGVSTPEHISSSYSGGTVIGAAVTYTYQSITNIATGEIIFPDINLVNVTNLSLGDLVALAPLYSAMQSGTYCISAIDPVENSIYLADCVTGNPILGWQVGGFINGQIISDIGTVFVNAENEIYLQNNLDLSTGFDNSLSSYEALLFTAPRVLNFNHNEIITGINIVDDMLFWTDNKTEPKRINIPSSVAGTNQFVLKSTRLINESQNITISDDVIVKEEHLTVIRKAPLTAPNLEMVGERRGNSYGVNCGK